jgi:hypothetical protein
MPNCGCSGNTTPQPCCNDCPETNPCEQGCLDVIDAGCIEYTGGTPECLEFSNNAKLDTIIQAIDDGMCALQQGADKFVRISSVDPISGYLNDKITTCDFLTKTIVTSGGQQKLQLCLDSEAIVSLSETNAIFMDTDGLNVNYTILVNTIINTPELLSALCDAISSC